LDLPSLQEIEAMDAQRQQAIASLEISNAHVKCQRCGIAIPIVGKLTLASIHGHRIDILQRRIEWIKGHYHDHRSKNEDLKALKQEVARLLEEEDAKYDKLRSLPLYSCRITGWKFVCSNSYDKVYGLVQGQ